MAIIYTTIYGPCKSWHHKGKHFEAKLDCIILDMRLAENLLLDDVLPYSFARHYWGTWTWSLSNNSVLPTTALVVNYGEITADPLCHLWSATNIDTVVSSMVSMVQIIFHFSLTVLPNRWGEFFFRQFVHFLIVSQYIFGWQRLTGPGY